MADPIATRTDEWLEANLSGSEKALVKGLRRIGVHAGFILPFIRERGKCGYCGRDLIRDRLAYAVGQVDHLLPKGKYGKLANEPDNWVLCCRLCNETKGQRVPDTVPKDQDEAKKLVTDPELRERLIEAIRNDNAEGLKGKRSEWAAVKKLCKHLPEFELLDP
ncbi:MAG: HNH endonuclease [Gammaproteobacteria bacterium]|nr:HNH endonuclease [Gammaproteobacteria bacterium]MDE0192750.1 HNH endonuclease [Gammaproteobacteria bacterium]